MTDWHTHTTFSFDGDNTQCEMAERAVSAGLSGIAFTEHIDVNYYLNEDAGSKTAGGIPEIQKYRFRELTDIAAREIPAVQASYAARNLTVIHGVELGNAQWDFPLAERILSGKNYPYVTASIHSVRGEEDFYYIDWAKTDVRDILSRYFSEMLELAQWGKFDTLAHMTYPVRYLCRCGKTVADAELSRYRDIAAEIFRVITDKGISLEINTGGLRKDYYNATDPGGELLRLYKDTGGERVRIGSDAHRVSEVAFGFREAAELAEQYGLTVI